MSDPHPLDRIMTTMGLCPACEAHFRKTFLAGLAQTFGLKPPEAPLAEAAVVAIGDEVEATRDLIGGRNHVVHFDGIDQTVVAVDLRPSPIFGTLVLKGTRGKVLWHAPEGTIVHFDLRTPYHGDGRHWGQVRALLPAGVLLSLRVVPPPAEAPAFSVEAAPPSQAAFLEAAGEGPWPRVRKEGDWVVVTAESGQAWSFGPTHPVCASLLDLADQRQEARTDRDIALADRDIALAERDAAEAAMHKAEAMHKAQDLTTTQAQLNTELTAEFFAGAGREAARAELAEVRAALQIGPDDTNPLPERVRYLVANYKQAREDREAAWAALKAANDEAYEARNERNTALEKLAKAEEVFADAIARRQLASPEALIAALSANREALRKALHETTVGRLERMKPDGEGYKQAVEALEHAKSLDKDLAPLLEKAALASVAAPVEVTKAQVPSIVDVIAALRPLLERTPSAPVEVSRG